MDSQCAVTNAQRKQPLLNHDTYHKLHTLFNLGILGDPGADSGGEGKSKRAGKYGTKKSKERREEPPGQDISKDGGFGPIGTFSNLIL